MAGRWKRDNLGGAFGVNNVKVDDEGWIVPSSGDPAHEDKENDAGSANDKKPPKVPRVYYATRTHSQIQQVVRELKRTAYRPAMVVLGSRDHYCIHPSVRKRGRNINEECKQLLERGVRGGGGSGESSGAPFAEDNGRGCGYSHGAMKLASNVSRQGAEPLDIEDLVTAGKKSRACPYFAAKHAAEGAELVFCPYNYLLDPAVRSAMDIDVKGAIVILDEAHNVEDTSREAASCDIDLERPRGGGGGVCRRRLQLPRRRRGAVGRSRQRTCARRPGRDRGERGALAPRRVRPGPPALSAPSARLRAVDGGLVRGRRGGAADARHGPRPRSVAAAEEAKRAVAKEANDAKTPADRRVSGAALKTAETLLTSARYALHGCGGVSGRGARLPPRDSKILQGRERSIA